MSPNRVLDSNGPDMKVRGSAAHINEKYRQLARDANASGDRVAAENYLQHAEHYHRLLAGMQEHAAQQRTQQQASASQPNGRDDRRGGYDRQQGSGGTDSQTDASDQAAPADDMAPGGDREEDAKSDQPMANGGEAAASDEPEKRAETKRAPRRRTRKPDITDGELAAEADTTSD